MKLAVTTGAFKGLMARFGDHYCVKNERPSKNVMVFIDDVYQPDTTTDFDVYSKDSPNEIMNAENFCIREQGFTKAVKAGRKLALRLSTRSVDIGMYVIVNSLEEVTAELLQVLPENVVHANSSANVCLYQNGTAQFVTAPVVDKQKYSSIKSVVDDSMVCYEPELTEYVERAFVAKYVEVNMFGHVYRREITDQDRMDMIKNEVEKFERMTGRTAFLDFVEDHPVPVVMSVPNRNNPARFIEWMNVLAK